MEKSQAVPFGRVRLERGFWYDRQAVNTGATLPAIRRQFERTGRFEAFRFGWKPGMPHPPHFFWDSDIAKWIEAVSYSLETRPDPRLEEAVDAVVELIARHQEPDGYFNIYFTVVEPGGRFTRRTHHELYCAGHLIEAAVAYAHATGKKRFLERMCRYADLIDRVFRVEKSAAFATPGHEEIELALVKLYRATGERRYLELSRWFIDSRGQAGAVAVDSPENVFYAQDHLPVRRQSTAEGHAVRAMYLYCAMADLAYEGEDEELLAACRRLFADMSERRMYITGGIGSSHRGESFTVDYDLPNRTAYAETCAAVGLALFCRRMLALEPDSRYADACERALYNGILSGVSLDGKSFFYENPLEIDRRLNDRDVSMNSKGWHPDIRRQEVFACSCCPPNLARLIASVGDFLYTEKGSTLFVHQYMDSDADVGRSGRPARVRQETRYPADGRVRLTVEGFAGGEVAVRVPGWCRRFRISRQGSPVPHRLDRGYAYLGCPGEKTVFELDFEMEPCLVEASPRVSADAGRVALQRGPVVYCLEAADNGPCLRDVAIDRHTGFRLEWSDRCGAYRIEADGFRRETDSFPGLYARLEERSRPQPLRFIPYYAFANRGEDDMIVWIGAR